VSACFKLEWQVAGRSCRLKEPRDELPVHVEVNGASGRLIWLPAQFLLQFPEQPIQRLLPGLQLPTEARYLPCRRGRVGRTLLQEQAACAATQDRANVTRQRMHCQLMHCQKKDGVSSRTKSFTAAFFFKQKRHTKGGALAL
jgi:hypothetical protein